MRKINLGWGGDVHPSVTLHLPI